MKRKGLIAVLTALIIMACTALTFADASGLQLESSYPNDGQKHTSIENVGVQLHFNGTFKNADVRKANSKLVKIEDSEGKKIKIKTLFSDGDDGLVLVIADNSNKKANIIASSETYTLTIGEGFRDDNGNVLSEAETVEFSTYNQKVNNAVNMVMMIVMFGGIMVVTLKQQKDQNNQKNKTETNGKETFNPYREAKRTGKSVEEVIAEEEKRVAKEAKKQKRKNKSKEKEKEAPQKINCAELLTNVYHVHEPRPIHRGEKKAAPAKNSKANSKGSNKK